MSLYEYHELSGDMPVIFHIDRIKQGESCMPNWHENIELLYCIKGRGHTVIDSQPFVMEQKSVTVINSNMLHFTETDSDIEYACLIIDSDFLKNSGLDTENICFDAPVRDDEINGYFDRIIREFGEKKPFYGGMIKGNVVLLISCLLRNHSSAKGESRKSSDAIKRGIIYINEHFKEDISASQTAEYAGFSRFYFSEKFKEATGCTVREYIQKLRCREAEMLLKTHGCSVSEAAAECGFSDVSYFTKVFKKQYGCVPSELKNRHSEKNNDFFEKKC